MLLAGYPPDTAIPYTTVSSGNGIGGTLGHYQLGDCIGRGAFGSVHRGLNMLNGEVVAMKRIRLGIDVPVNEVASILMELDLLKRLSHPSIVKYLGHINTAGDEYDTTSSFSGTASPPSPSLYILLEYCEGGSLLTVRQKFGTFSEQLVAVYTAQILEGLVYLHEQGVVHRDVKAGNVLATKEGRVKLADFGVAIAAQHVDTASGNSADDMMVVGSPYWMAPEIVQLCRPTAASDVWSLGITVIELLTGQPPYFDMPPLSALFQIVQCEQPPLPENASPLLCDFLTRALQKEPVLRPTARQLLQHPWLSITRSTVSEMSGKNHVAPMIADGRPPATIVNSVHDAGEDEDGDFLFDDDGLDGHDFTQLSLTNRAAEVQVDWDATLDVDFDGIALSTADQQKISANTELAKILGKLNQKRVLVHAADMLTMCETILSTFMDYPEFRSEVVTHRGLIPLLEQLERAEDPALQYCLLKIINQLADTSTEMMENLCYLGALPLLLPHGLRSSPLNHRREVMYFLQRMFERHAPGTEMLISCGGMEVLGAFLDENYGSGREFVLVALEGIHYVLHMQKHSVRNDLCILFTKDGLLSRIIDVFRHIVADRNADSILVKTLETLQTFSRSDNVVKEVMSERLSIKALVNQMNRLPLPYRLALMKVIKNLSLTSTALAGLEKARALDVLAPMLSYRAGGVLQKELRNQALYILFNYCNVHRGRLEQAATTGVIPHLLFIVRSQDPLKQFALPILCDLAHGGQVCRDRLWTCDGLGFYFGLLGDGTNEYWQLNAMEAILAWLIEEPERVEQTILQRSNINTLLTVITTADSKLLASILGPLQKLLLSSIPITRALSSDMRFLRTIVEQVQGEETVHSALTQLHLLKILLFVWRFHARPAELAGMFREAVVPLVEGASSVLVQEMASRIMEEMADCEKDPAGHKGKEHGAALMKGTA